MVSLVASITVRRSCVYSPNEHELDRRGAFRLLGALTDPDQRLLTAQALAQHLGAETLLVFLYDAEVETYLPAPGFVQTLPSGRAWREFLQACAEQGYWVDQVPFPTANEHMPAVGMCNAGGAVLVLLGGTPRREAVDELALLLPLLAAALVGERTAGNAQAQVTLLRRAATEAQTLAEGLDAARLELQRLYGDVRAALNSRDAFLSSVTHDLMTPLTSVLGYVQLLQRRLRRLTPADAARFQEGLDQIEITGIRMRRQVEQLLDVARLQMGRPLELERRPTDLVALCWGACREMQMSSDRHRLVLDARAERIIGAWDALRLERLLDNLLSNAIKYSPAGGEVRLTVQQEDDAGAPWAVLSVRDPGIGIPAADLAHIFSRFYRAANTAQQMTGSGIGLASARQIVQEHGGVISAVSAEGEGSVFTVRLPLESSKTIDPIATPLKAKSAAPSATLPRPASSGDAPPEDT